MEQNKYAEIIDKGECLSTINVPPAVDFINWDKLESVKRFASRNEWVNSNFYPSNGLVGEIEGVLYNSLTGFDVYILKVQNKHYVPMTAEGIRFISEAEMKQKQTNVESRGMDERQKKINSDYDQIMERPFSIGKPKYTEIFKQDLVANLTKASNEFTKQLYMKDIEKEAIMYSCDICLEFDKKSNGTLTQDWIQHIVSEVCDVMEKLFKEFNLEFRNSTHNSVIEMMNNKYYTKMLVEKYYDKLRD